ncbi:MAG: UDP-glucose 4-epimerase GalE [Hyphomonadaceae bacterium]|nr:UDP-glucose 4-epimerase GalE [Hyphomonadaceae bacterium]
MAVQRVLVCGGAGYIGAHTAKALHMAGREPIVFDNMSTGKDYAVRWGPLVKGDIRDAEALRAVIRQYKPDTVMNFAARIEVGEGERDPGAFYDNNVSGVLNLLRTVVAEGVPNFVFSSTCAIYGNPERLPLTEDLPKNPVSVYGRTKLVCEQMLEDFSRAYGLRFAALRYFNAAGADIEGNIGQDYAEFAHLIPNALLAAIGRTGPMKLFGNDYPTKDGTCVRDFIHVTDLAEAHVLAADKVAATGESLQLNLGTGHGLTVMEVLQAIERATGRPVPYTLFPRRAGDAVALYADTTRVTQTLGWKPHLSDIDTICSSAWNFHKKSWGIAQAAE